MTDIYVATDGSDSNDGTINSPLATIREAIETMEPGDTTYVRGGVYDQYPFFYRDSGKSEAPLTVRNYGNEAVWIDGNKFRIGQAEHIRIRGINVRNNDGVGLAVAKGAADVLVEGCEAYGNTNDGFRAVGGAHDVMFRNCISHDNVDQDFFDGSDSDPDADGFNCTVDAYNVTFENCSAWNNLDDGWDLNNAGYGITIENCRAWHNGYDSDGNLVGNGRGFKLGAGKRTVSEDPRNPVVLKRCAAWANRIGFGWNNAEAVLHTYNCTSVDNVWKNFRYQGWQVPHVLKNNISYKPDPSASEWKGDSIEGDEFVSDSNTWDLDIDDPEFVSLDPRSAEYLQLAEGSPAIDAGTTATPNAVVRYYGDAPDLGAREYEPLAEIKVRNSGSYSAPTNTRYYDGSQWKSAPMKVFSGDRFVTAFDKPND